MNKILTFSIALALTTPMMAESLRVFRCTEDGIPGRTEPMLMGLAISPDGNYVAGTIQQGAGLFIADCNSGEVKYLAAGEKSSELRGVDNRGVGIGFIDDNGALYSYLSGEESFIPVPTGSKYYIQGEGISNDGKVMVGSFTSFGTEAAICCGDEGWKHLAIPSDEEKGSLKDFMNSQSAAKYVSADGSVVMGHLGSFSYPIIWTRNDAGEYVPDFYPARFVKTSEADRYDDSKPLFGLNGMYICMSNNGRYAAAIGTIPNEEYTALRIVPVVYDTEEKTLKVYSEMQEIDDYGIGLYPRAIADDGTFIGTIDETALPANMGCFIMRAGEEQAELYIDAFPEFYDFLGDADMLGQNIPTGISADGNRLTGYAFYSADYDLTSDEPAYYLTYLITREGTGVEEVAAAPAAVPQAIYSVDGRKLSRLQKGLNIIRNADGTTTKLLK